VTFTEICWHTSILVKIRHKWRTLNENAGLHAFQRASRGRFNKLSCLTRRQVLYSNMKHSLCPTRIFYKVCTERRGWVVNNPISCSGCPGFKSRLGDRLPWLRSCRSFPRSLQANAGIVSSIRPQTFPSKFFPIHYHSTLFAYRLSY
jgi:hypothetical protein